MPSFSSRLSQDIENFYPNETLLPKNAFAKGVLFTLGVLGFATMFLQPSIAEDGNSNLSVSTSLSNNIMSVGKLSVISWSTTSVILDSNGIKLPSETSTTTLLKLVNKYIKPSALTGSDIGPNMITTEKIADETIKCEDLSVGLQALLCNTTTAPTLSCPAGQYLIGITTGAWPICTGSSAGGLPACNPWDSVKRNGSTWVCDTPAPPITASWVSLWATDMDDDTIIYNKNLAGKVGIGMTSPSATLSVSGSLLVKNTSGNVLYVTGANGGRVGILTNNPLYPLDVAGSIRASAYLQSSDARLKTNISAIPDALGKLLGINWYTYNLKSDGSFHYWVIAQEIEKFFPYLVSTDENGMKSVNYNGLVAPIIESIKTLNTKIDTLEVQLNANTSRIEALEKLQK